MRPPILVILAGLPATGKSTIARGICRQIAAAHVRVDTIEQVLRAHSAPVSSLGYEIACALAADNLRNRLTTVVDSVNPVEASRRSWRNVASRLSASAVEIEVVRSDPADHRFWVESRTSDVEGLVLPRWERVLARTYDPWSTMRNVIDTSGKPPEVSIAEALAIVQAA